MKKPNIALRGPGFYIALLLCLTIAGVSGYMILFGGSNTADPSLTEPDHTVLATPPSSGSSPAEPDLGPAQDTLAQAPMPTEYEVGGPPKTEDIPADPPEMPEVEVAPAMEVDTTPVEAEPPQLVVHPLRGEVLAAFSVDALAYDKTMGDWRTHDGKDIAAAAGTQVMAASAGTVLSVTSDPLMGTTVTLSHKGGYQTIYSNLQAQPNVSAGDTVSAGQVIGAVGTTAIAESALGPHLHFAVTQDGDAVDPDTFLQS